MTDMTTLLQELDEVLEINTQVIEAQRINEYGAAHFFQQKFDYKASAFLRTHAPEIRAALELKARMAWQPIETAPREGLLLLWGRYWSDDQGWMKDPLIGIWDERAQRWECFARGTFGIHPTHWMPLPAPPAQGEQDGT